jgi:sugar lactone lactonase YvrE
MEHPLRFELFVDAGCELAESPVWDDRRRRLWWVDIPRGALHVADEAAGSRQVWHFDSPLASLGLCESGGLILAFADRVALWDPDRPLLTTLWERPASGVPMRFNDGKVGPDGCFWVGAMDLRAEKQPVAALWRIRPDGKAEEKCSGIRVSNGLAWSKDGRIMLHSDSRGPWIDCWDFDPATGSIAGGERLADLDEGTGRPDGGACDMAGSYWSCGVSAGRLNRFALDGTLLSSHGFPVPCPTMPAFGGSDLRTLYVTSHRENFAAERLAAAPLSGAVFRAEAPAAGVPVHRFGDVR